MWSEFQRQAAALACGLSLIAASAPLSAASGKPSVRPVASKALKKPVKGKAIKRRQASVPESGAAEILDAVGLHGAASFYGRGFQGRKTSSGERFDARQFTAASNHFPLGSMVAVRRPDNDDLCAIVKINDRMAGHRQRIIDVSRSVADYLDMIRAGVVLVRVAPLKAGGGAQGLSACHAAFEPEIECADCGRPPGLPDFTGEAEP